jgi:hypothetical protein
MADGGNRTERGRTILAGLSQYPLPPRADRRDFVFYLVPESDSYGRYSRAFFRTYYARHIEVSVTSLEHLFSRLARYLARAGPTARIREIVIVAHSNSWGVNAPLTNADYLAKQAGKDAPEWYAPDIADLQQTIRRDDNAFQQAREQVLRHLDDDSWVTIRSCNFGFSPEGMYALWTIFGGKANLYALRAYMTFVLLAIGPESRIRSNAEAATYLRKQGLIDRLIAPGSGSDTQLRRLLALNDGRLPIQFFIPEDTVHDYFEGMVARLVSKPPREDAEPSLISFDDLMAELEGGRTTGLIKLLQREEITFSGRPRLQATQRRREWTMRGRAGGAVKTYRLREGLERLQDGSARREVKLYEAMNPALQLGSELPWTRYGTPYDVPGTEIQAYLDRFSIDDLTCLQDVVRMRSGQGDVVIIEQAQRSIARRLNFMAWFSNTKCFRTTIDDPLFGPEDELSCYWSPYPPRGLKDHEQDDLESVAHTDHNGYRMWADVKAQQAPSVQFRDDIFLEHPLPRYAEVAAESRLMDTVVVGDEVPGPARSARRGGRLARRKDEPREGQLSGIPSPPALRGLSDAELLAALDQILAQRRLGPQPFGANIQHGIEVAQLTINTLISVVGEVEVWAPASLLARIAETDAWELGVEGLWSLILDPLIGIVLTEIDLYRATEAHRAWGMRAALGQATRALLVLSTKLRDGQDIPNLTIPAVREEGNVEREVELRNYVATARKALELENFGFIHEKFLAGYDLVISEVAKLTNEVVRETDELVRQEFRDLGLTDRQVEIVLKSGIINLKTVYAMAFEGLARFLSEQISRFIVK